MTVQWIGLAGILAARDVETVLLNRNVSAAVLLLMVLAAAAYAAWLYRRETALGAPFRVFLGVLRTCALVLVVLLLLEPAFRVRETSMPKKTVLVMIDASESMGIRDIRKTDEDILDAAVALGDVPFAEAGSRPALARSVRERLAQVSRLDLVKGVVDSSDRNLPGRLPEDYVVRYCQFAETAESLAAAPPFWEAEGGGPQAAGKTTHLGSAIEEAVNRCGADTPAGVVIFTDGAVNGGRDVLDVAGRMGQRAIPLYPVGVGLARPDDVSLHDLVVQDVAFPGDTVPARLQIRSHGFEKRLASVSVTLNGRQLSRRSLVLTGEPQFEDISFEVPRSQRGHAELDVTVAPFADEATHVNNRLRKTLRIVDEKINVLCIEGSARWEFRYLRAILKRDPRLNVKFIATRAKPELARLSREHITRFPADPEEAFAYDLVILGDVDASFFGAEELLRLEELVRDRAGSLLMLAGRRAAPAAYAGTPVERLLPVRFEADGQSELVEKTAHPVLTPAGRHSMVMILDTPKEKNDAIWARIKPLGRLPPLTGVKPGSIVLARLSDAGQHVAQYPVIAWQRYGSGKVMFIATDRLWRLRFKTGDKYHWRLWSQAIQFLTLSRLLGEHKRIKIETDRTVYAVGEQVRVYAHVSDEAYQPATLPAFDVYLKRTDAGTGDPALLRLKPEPMSPGLYQGYTPAAREGTYGIQPGPTHRPFANEATFRVRAVEREFAETAMREPLLQKMAALSGGRYLRMRDLPALPEMVRDRRRRVRTLRREITLWDTGWAPLALLALVGTEWFLRRRNDLA